MKTKAYMAPASRVIKLEHRLLADASITGVGGDSGIGMGDPTQPTPGTADSRRRRHTFWDDED